MERRREMENDLDAVRHINDRGFLVLFFDESVAKEISDTVKYGDGFN